MRSRKRKWRGIVAIMILVTLMTQTSYSAVMGIMDRNLVYAYADDELDGMEAPDPDFTGEEVDLSGEDEEVTEESGEEEAGDDAEEAAPDIIEEEASQEADTEKSVVGLRAEYRNVDGETVLAGEDFDIDDGSVLILADDAPYIEGYTYKEAAVEIAGEEYIAEALYREGDTYSYTDDMEGGEEHRRTLEEDTNVNPILFTE